MERLYLHTGDDALYRQVGSILDEAGVPYRLELDRAKQGEFVLVTPFGRLGTLEGVLQIFGKVSDKKVPSEKRLAVA